MESNRNSEQITFPKYQVDDHFYIYDFAKDIYFIISSYYVESVDYSSRLIKLHDAGLRKLELSDTYSIFEMISEKDVILKIKEILSNIEVLENLKSQDNRGNIIKIRDTRKTKYFDSNQLDKTDTNKHLCLMSGIDDSCYAKTREDSKDWLDKEINLLWDNLGRLSEK